MEQKLAGVFEKASIAWRNVMALYGEAMCSAQILERELVQVLAFLRSKTGIIRDEEFDWAYEKMMYEKPSDILVWIQGTGGNLSRDSQEAIKKALQTRNFLAHKFFHQYNPVMSASQSRRTSVKLQKFDSDLKVAFELLQPLRLKLEKELGLSERRQKIGEDFRERFVQAIVSFKDE